MVGVVARVSDCNVETVLFLCVRGVLRQALSAESVSR